MRQKEIQMCEYLMQRGLSVRIHSHLSVYGHIMAYSVIVVMIEQRIDAFKVWRLMLSDEVSQFRYSESGKLLSIRPAFQIFFHVSLADGCWCWHRIFLAHTFFVYDLFLLPP